MKLKKLISSALVFVMLFTTLVAVIPVSSFAEESESFEFSVYSGEAIEATELQNIFKDYRRYGSTFENKEGTIVTPFANAKALLEYETSMGYIDYAKYGNYAIYVNRYTGFMYFENGLTGQILTSNPIDPAYKTKENGVTDTLSSPELSQVELHYFELANTANKDDYDSYEWILENNQAPTVTATENGLDVEYILGTSLASFTAPYALLYSTAVEKILHPMFENLAALVESKCGAFNASVYNGIPSYDARDQQLYKDEAVDTIYNKTKIKDAVSNIVKYVEAYDKQNGTAFKASVNDFASQIKSFLNYYTFVDPAKSGGSLLLGDVMTAFAEGQAICVLEGADSLEPTVTLTTLRLVDKAIKTACPAFTLDDASAAVEECGYVPNTDNEKPSFRVTLSYSIAGNGDLVVTVPANKISFPDTFCTIEYISPLKYFGCGDMSRDGYLFYPDGSGALLEFDDFYYGVDSDKNMRISMADNPVYGVDYCFAEIVGMQNRQQITMPVYGLVNEVNSTGIGYSKDKDVVTNGYFAVIEEGAALASIGYRSGGGIHKYISIYPTFKPFPTDKYDLSQTISVSGNTSYQVASPAKYPGNMTMRFTMLTDDAVNAEALSKDSSFGGFAANYVGMASCYRAYLERSGVVDKISEAYSDMPLYIEALGSIDVTKKILSFPVTVSESLTSFDDIIKMYDDLSNASATLKAKADENYAEAAKIEAGKYPELHQDEIKRYKALGDKYSELSEYVTDIKNVNFKLTGFANGGMHATYPAKLKWQNSLGGNGGFNKLLDYAKGINYADGQSMGVYPDFDFLYISNTAIFDGISHRRISAKMVDSRYASKQSYDSVNQKFEKLFDLLVSSSYLNELYDKFEKQYSGYDAKGISVSTLGSDINSNFDIDNPIDRETARGHIANILSRMAEKYDVMVDTGNVYALEYASHVLNIPTDSSHYNATSRTIPFVGLVLHGYVNYAGTPLNYSGSPDYEILRSIENGASLYYILCMENTNYLKEDLLLSQYYGVDYNNLFEKIVAQYKVLNDAIGDLQLYTIADHKNIIAERIIDSDEMDLNYKNLMNEFASVLDSKISSVIDLKIKSMRDTGKAGRGLVFDVSAETLDAILGVAAERVNLSVEELKDEFGFDKVIASVVEKYKAQYNKGSEQVTISAEDMVNYRSAYSYVTDSVATDENYVYTDFTCDNGNVVMVTYEKEVNGKTDTVVFLLNYNIFSVKIKVDETIHENFAAYADEEGYITIDKYDFVKIMDKEG